MEQCDICEKEIIYKNWLSNPDWFSLKNNHYCSKECKEIGRRKRDTGTLQKEKCPVCYRKFNIDSSNRGKEYKFLCTICELLAFKVDHEEEIKEETRYI